MTLILRVGETVLLRGLGDCRFERANEALGLVTVGGGHAGGQLGWIHVGLGTADGAEVRVTWPDGDGPWLLVESDGFVVLERGSPGATPWSP